MSKIKTCKMCGATSERAEFYKGFSSRCKECHKGAVRKNRAEKVDYYRAYDANRFQNDPRVKARHKRYLDTDAGKASMQKARLKWLAQNPEKRAAHVILGNAVRDGRVVKPDRCTDCGESKRLHGHHEDYTKPLEVVWLCSKCHEKAHRTP